MSGFNCTPVSGDYKNLIKQLEALTDGVGFRITNLANAASLLYNSLPDINWAGFYLLEKNELLLGPFMGKPACVRIAIGKGVCGSAAEKRETVVALDVHEFPGHIACDADSRSEIVIPLMKDEELLGVLDIDSPSVNRFSSCDRAGLEQFAKLLESRL